MSKPTGMEFEESTRTESKQTRLNFPVTKPYTKTLNSEEEKVAMAYNRSQDLEKLAALVESIEEAATESSLTYEWDQTSWMAETTLHPMLNVMPLIPGATPTDLELEFLDFLSALRPEERSIAINLRRGVLRKAKGYSWSLARIWLHELVVKERALTAEEVQQVFERLRQDSLRKRNTGKVTRGKTKYTKKK